MLKKLIAEDEKKQLSVKTIEDMELVQHKNKIYVPAEIWKKPSVEWYDTNIHQDIQVESDTGNKSTGGLV